MQNNKNLEVEYIIDSINKQKTIEHSTGDKLNINDKVRLIEKNKTLLKKTRYNVTPFYFTISDITGKEITISAADGSVKTVTRSRIIPLSSQESLIKEDKKIGTSSNNVVRGTISEILKYNPKNDTYKVKYDMPNDNDSEYIEPIKSKVLRGNKPLLYYLDILCIFLICYQTILTLI
jgi:hypothetical protein